MALPGAALPADRALSAWPSFPRSSSTSLESLPLPEREPPPDNRWQRGGVVDALYLADDEDTVWAEWHRHLAEPAARADATGALDLGDRYRGRRSFDRGAARRGGSSSADARTPLMARHPESRRAAPWRRVARASRAKCRAADGQGALPLPRQELRSRRRARLATPPDSRASPSPGRPANLTQLPEFLRTVHGQSCQ